MISATLPMTDFFQDVWRGLTASPKYLQSKYFYNEKGDAIFREIMDCPEYYLTRCELEIFSKGRRQLADAILGELGAFDIVELGPGDATKSVHLLDELLKQGASFNYYPIDISENVIRQLNKTLPGKLKGLHMQGLNGEYFDMLEELKEITKRNKVVLFMGGNVGNILLENTIDFFKALKLHLVPGDLVLTGFDLKKDPAVILAAYNDKGGITRRFNLNLLQRINNTMDADFDLSQFDHRPVYDEQSGACRSYLVSKKDQRVRIGEMGWINLKAGEKIFMEISQKYTVAQIDEFAKATGFSPIRHFYDSRKWFVDALWQCK